jgi:hypothetical protein
VEQITTSSDRYRFYAEGLSPNLEAIKHLLEQNHLETGVYNLPFDPDYDRYLRIEANCRLAFFTVRTVESELVGFALFFLDSEIQQRNIRSATQSLNFISKKHRGSGYAFMKFCDDILKKRGVDSIWRQATTKFDIGKIYERMGYQLIEKSYLRRL